MACFPLMVEVEGKTVLVIGGGRIALHKIKILINFGVHIIVVSRDFSDELIAFSKIEEYSITLINHDYDDKYLVANEDDLCFVVAATDDEDVQTHISNLCQSKGIPINVVDVKDKSTFFFPAIEKQEDLVIAVSTGGKFPAAAGYIRNKIKKAIPSYYGRLVDTLDRYKDLLRSKISDYDIRKNVSYDLLEQCDSNSGELSFETVNKRLSDLGEG